MSLPNSDYVMSTDLSLLIKNEIGANPWSFLDWLWKRQNAEYVRDTIIAMKRRCPYLAATLSIDEEQQERPDDAEEQEKAIPPQRMTLRKVWVRERLTRRPEFGQYDNLLTEVHKEDQRGYKNNLRITPDLFQECLGMACTATRWHVSSRIIHDEFTNSWRIVHDPFAKFCLTQILNISKLSSRLGMQSRQVYAHFMLVYD